MSYTYVPGIIGIQSNVDQEGKKAKKMKKKQKGDSANKSSMAISARKSAEHSTPKDISAPKSAIPEPSVVAQIEKPLPNKQEEKTPLVANPGINIADETSDLKKRDLSNDNSKTSPNFN